MSIQILVRYAVTLLFTVFISGCSISSIKDSFTGYSNVDHENACTGNRSACIYKGSYEPGERDFAEQEARRLNQASLARLRRASVR